MDRDIVSSPTKAGAADSKQKRYLCKICGDTIFVSQFRKHLVKHDIDSESYYQQHINHNSATNCVVCGNPLRFVNVTVGYGKTCSRSCRGVICGQATQNKHPDHTSKMGKQTQIKHHDKIKEWGSRGGKRFHELYPGWASQMGKRNGAANMRKLVRFRQETGFRSDEERLLFNHPRFKELNPVYEHPVSYGGDGCYSLDFLIGALVVEINGSFHNHEWIKQRDEKKYEFLRSNGYQVLVVTNEEINQDIESVIDRIKATLPAK